MDTSVDPSLPTCDGTCVLDTMYQSDVQPVDTARCDINGTLATSTGMLQWLEGMGQAKVKWYIIKGYINRVTTEFYLIINFSLDMLHGCKILSTLIRV